MIVTRLNIFVGSRMNDLIFPHTFRSFRAGEAGRPSVSSPSAPGAARCPGSFDESGAGPFGELGAGLLSS